MRQTVATRYATQPQNGVWTQAETFPIHLKQDPQADCQLHILLVVKDQSQFVNLSSFYQSIYLRFQTLAQSYNPAKTDEFIASFTRLIQELKTDSEDLQIEIAAAYQVDNQLFVGGDGGTTATLVRNGELGKILDSSHGVTTAHGTLNAGDLILLASSQFYVEMPYIRLKQVLLDRYGELSVETITSELAVYFGQKVNQQGIGFIFAQYALGQPVTDTNTNTPHLNTLQQKFKGMKLFPRRGDQVYVKRKITDRKRQRLSITLVLSLLLLLGISISLGWWRRQRLQEQRAYEAIVNPVQVLMTQAEQQRDLNVLMARSLLQQAKTTMEAGLTDFDQSSRYYAQLTELNQQLQAAYESVSGELQVQPSQFLDLTFIEPGFSADRLGLFEDRLIILDTVGHRVVTVGVENKDPSRVWTDNRITGASLVSGAIEDLFIFTDQGVLKLNRETEELEFAIEKDPDWQKPVGFGTFAGNVYILDSQQNEIWRYRSVAGDQFVRQRWLGPGVSPEFTNVVDIVIDGDIWVLDADSTLRRYSRGVGEVIELRGVEEGVQAKSLGITGKNIYIFDQNHSKVLVFDKEGQYSKQFIWSDIGLVTDMEVVQDRIFLLANDKIYTISNQ